MVHTEGPQLTMHAVLRVLYTNRYHKQWVASALFPLMEDDSHF